MDPIKVDKAKELYETTIVYLLRTQPFFASLLLRMQVEFSGRIPTAGVYVKERIHLIINPEFFNELTLQERIAVVIHECYHCINNHFVRYKNNNKKLFNIAADIAINQYIQNIPQTLMINGQKGKTATIENMALEGIKLDPRETAEYYYKRLYQEVKKNKMKESGDGSPQPIDDHDIWEEGFTSEEVVKQVLAQNVNKAVEDTKKRSIGKIPSEVLLSIDRLNRSIVDWKNVLRRFVSNSAEIYKVETRSRRNRRYGLLYPGDKTECKTNITAIIDTSGSMSPEQLSEIQGELMAMTANQIEVTLIQCDAKVHSVQKYQKNQEIQFHGGGGTDMNDAFAEAKKHQPDGIICFTDGYIPPTANPKVKTLWVITGNKDFKQDFGESLHLEGK